MNKKIAFVSDFDGTISFDDFFFYVVDAYLTEENLDPWHKYRAGEKSHFDALKEIFEQIHVPKQEFDNFIAKINIDEHTDIVWDLCIEKNIPMSICSAGNDYYIKQLVGDKLEKYNIDLITNPATYSQEQGLQMYRPDESDPYYNFEVGISKSKVIQELKEQGYFVIFAGDGPPDVEPALISDVVFARKFLLEECTRLGKKTENFDSYLDIYNYIKEL